MVKVLAFSAGAVLVAFLAGFGAFLTCLDRFEREPAATTDGIVALTGGAQRIGDAIDLLAKGFGGRLLITGVNERTSRDEIARLNPHQRGLVECCVDLDYRARNTLGNAAETRRWARMHGFRSLIVVTSNYHMPRTLIELDRALPDLHKVPYAVVTNTVDAGSWWHNAGTARLLLAEYTKFVAALARAQLPGAVAAERSTPDAAEPSSPAEPMRLVAKPVPAR